MRNWDPKQWAEKLSRTGDLKGARSELNGSDCCHRCRFFREGMKGRIASLMFELEDANGLFESAAQMGIDDQVRGTRDNVRRAVILEAYKFENSLLLDRVPEEALSQSPIAAMQRMDWRLQRALALSIAVRAMAHLHQGDDEQACRLFDEAVSAHTGEAKDELIGLWRIGSACCERNLGEIDRSMKTIESAELLHSFAGPDDKLNSTALAAALYAIWDSIGETQKAEVWRKTIIESRLPASTTKAFIDRATLIIFRCVSTDRLVLL